MDYKIKYLKYKNKYLELKKNLVGGEVNACLLENINSILSAFKNKNFTKDDVTSMIKLMHNMKYAEFENHMRQIIITTYNIISLLPVWYVRITGNCNKCSQKMKIFDKDEDNKYYYCDKCNNLYTFTNIDIDPNVIINDFTNFIKSN